MGASTTDKVLRNELEQYFPGLKGSDYRPTSEKTKQYNCIAFAAGDTKKWWWPANDGYWPSGVPKAPTVAAFVEMFRAQGYDVCATPSLDFGYRKIAIFADARGVPTHATRQLSSGKWISKLGPWIDIEHELNAISGNFHADSYGHVVVVMRKATLLWRLHDVVRAFIPSFK